MNTHIHRTHRSGWLRAGVLGANDGVLSISSLMLGVAAAHTSASGVLTAGLAGLVGGALSMGAGEYISVCSQADAENADLQVELKAIEQNFVAEHLELRDIYVRRGLGQDLATEVSKQLMTHDALGAHARDDIGITDALTARPIQAALTSAASFSLGGIVPVLAVILIPAKGSTTALASISLVFLALLGALAARAGGASMTKGAIRVVFWGAFVMATTGVVGAFFGAPG